LVAQSAVAFVQARLEEDQQFARQPIHPCRCTRFQAAPFCVASSSTCKIPNCSKSPF
jgi:hypothetical protein